MKKKETEAFYQKTTQIVVDNDVEELKKALHIWNTKLKDDSFRLQVLGISLIIAEMNDSVECAKLILAAEYRTAQQVNEATGRTALDSAKAKNTCVGMINLLKAYIIH